MSNEVQTVENAVTDVAESVSRAPMSSKTKGVIIAAGALTLGAAVGGYFLFRRLRRVRAAKKANENPAEQHTEKEHK